jgi:uncharacterized membrane protein HdeD (DUF308 family)
MSEQELYRARASLQATFGRKSVMDDGTRVAPCTISCRFVAVIGGYMAEAFSSDVRRVTGWSIALSVLMIIAGLLAIASPLLAGVTVTRLVGWLLLFSGVLHFVYAFRGGGVTAVLWEILLAVVYALAGVYILANTAIGLVSLAFVIAFYLFAESILELAASYMTRHEKGSGWLLFDGILTLLLAIMIWGTWPSSAAWVIGTLVGVSMLFSGISRLMMASAVRRITA